jgi:hypothetical protein
LGDLQRIIELFTQKIVIKLPKNIGLGSGILDLDPEKPYSGSGVKKEQDPGSRSATLSATF